MSVIRNPLRIVDGIQCFIDNVDEDHSDYQGKYLENLFAVEQNHFWFVTRKERIITVCQNYLQVNSRVLEIGAGTAYVADGLQRAGFKIEVGDLHLSGLRHAKSKGIRDCYQFDLIDPPFKEEYDGIGMFDVLEHLNDDLEGLVQVTKMLKNNGLLFITVPAHQWLWSRIDIVASHKRRYSKKELVQKIEKVPLKVVNVEYFFCTILPLLFVRHLIDNSSCDVSGYNEVNNNAESLLAINPLLNNALRIATRCENFFSKWMPDFPGGSILIVAKKNG